MNLNSKEKWIQLFEFYNKLLTRKQQEYFKLYFFEDYSFSEISELKKISRNAVYDSILKITTNFEKFEDKLKLNLKNHLREKLYVKYYNDNSKILINELKNIDEIE